MTLYRKDDTNAFEQNFIEIELENAFGIEITKAEFRCGQVLKSFESPLFPLKIDLTSDETEKLSYTNTCYLAIYDEKGRKRTCEGSLTFPTKGAVV